MKDNVTDLKPFFEPRSIAIVGASRKVGPGTANALENLIGYGYGGKIYPVNPKADEILGIKAYPSIASIDGPVDHAVLVTPRGQVPGQLRECIEKGIWCATIVTQGFSDSDDEEGKLLHKEILQLANSSGLRILGPNSFGSANAYCGFGSSFGKLNLQKNGIGLICQSGGLFNGVAELCFAGKAIDVGNICNVDFSDCLEYFENDPETKVVVLHIEGMPDTSRFLSIAKRVTRRKPVIAIKTGKSQQAVKAAQSHTGSLAGNNEIWAAALAQSGIITVDSFEELVDMARVFSRLPVIKKPDICVATFSGGTAIMALDGFKNSRLFAGELSEKTKSAIRKFAPSWLPIGNPVDYWPMVMGSPNLIQNMKEIFDILLADEQFGGLFIIQIVNDAFMVELIGRLVQTVVDEHPDKPVVASFVGPGGLDCVKWLQNNGKALAFTSPERAARALARRYDYPQYT